MSSDNTVTAAAPRRLRVAHVGSDPYVRGGMPAMLRDLLASPLGDRHDLEPIPTYRTRAKVDRVVVFARGLFKLVRWCLGPGPRLVHVHTAVRGSWYRKAIVVTVVKILRRPVLLHLHVGKWDIDEFYARSGRIQRWLFRRLFHAADCVVSVSSAGAKEIDRYFGRADVIVVPNAAPAVEPFEDRPHDAQRPSLLYVGGFQDPAKGGQVLLAALPAIMRERPELRVTLAGPGELPADGHALVHGHEGVHWLGWLDPEHKRAEFIGADVFILPSVSEGLPVALLEAMAYGKAIVATEMGGVPDVLDAGVEAELVAPGDPAALAAAILDLVGDAGKRARFGAAAAARAATLSPEAVTERLDAIYQALCPA